MKRLKKIKYQQGYSVQHKEFNSILYSNLNGKGFEKKRDACICIIKSLCCTLETITILLINYTPI